MQRWVLVGQTPLPDECLNTFIDPDSGWVTVCHGHMRSSDIAARGFPLRSLRGRAFSQLGHGAG